MSSSRSGSTPSRPSSSNPRPNNGIRPTLASILHHPTASATAVPTLSSPPKPERRLSFPAAGPKAKQSPHHNPSRIIKTFNEVEVTKIVMAEEWYEELECGICSQILGAAMSLVPCGHTFCGPCTWHWIMSNKNSTCPHCRVQVPTANPFIPNIIVDQVIERKLKALPDSKERTEMVVELKEKIDEWKAIQIANPPAKPAPPKRGRSFEEFLNLVVPPVPERQERTLRRASANISELGPPVALGRQARPYHQMTLAEIHRAHADEDALVARAAATAAEVRRLRELNQRQGMALAALVEGDDLDLPSVPPRPAPQPARRRQPSDGDDQHPPPGGLTRLNQSNPASASRTSLATSGFGGRPPAARATGRPSVFASRQARGRDSGSRDAPLVVSDSD